MNHNIFIALKKAHLTAAVCYVAGLPAGAWVSGVTPGSLTITVRVSAEVRIQVCSGMCLGGDAAADTSHGTQCELMKNML